MAKDPSYDDVRAALHAQLGVEPAEATLDLLVETVVAARWRGELPVRPALKLVVRRLCRQLAEEYPGRTVEVRVPPYAAVQCVQGPRHTRGTPPNVVEADPVAWVDLCAGLLAWRDATRDGRVRASGERSDLSVLLPLTGRSGSMLGAPTA